MLKAAFPDAVPEYRFHPQRRWRFDWYIPSRQVAIEIEGGVWITGRHTRPAGYVKDIEKYNTATLMGIRIYRIVRSDIKSAQKIIEHFDCINKYLRSI
jgi:hypothetical protein